jgi:3-hydroxyisobutyrate dehydrogenase-like beta-hydroxyacid dehydrogenase
MRIGILGLGEAGGAIAAGLRAAGVAVRGYDPDPMTRPDARDTAEAVVDADLVLSLTTAEEALVAARAAAPHLHSGQVYVDANTRGAALKRELAGVVAPARFADAALMAPVRGVRTPAIVSGPGARRTAELLGALMPITVLDGEPGLAATRKLLRSVAWKGIAATVCEALAAARAAGVEDWMREELVALFAAVDLERIEDGSRRHAVRREHEMGEVVALLRELGVPSHVAEASRAQLGELRA